MGFQSISKIESPQIYIDVAFNAGQQKVSGMKKKPRPKLEKVRFEEIERIRTVKKVLVKAFNRIISEFPSLDELSDFYKELVKCTLSYDELKRSLGAMKWANKKITDFFRVYDKKIRKSGDLKNIIKHRKEFLGRVASVIKQIKAELELLERARITFRGYPSIKNMTTVTISGFPNVGKTTLLSKLTEARPEIAAYPFTTKDLNIGYAKYRHQRVQFIDTPGTLNRFDKMNYIEKQAFLAMKHCADAIIYIFDLTEPYPIEEQEKLLRRLKKSKKNIILYLSKTDIVDKKTINNFNKKYDAATRIEELNKRLLRFLNLNAKRARKL